MVPLKVAHMGRFLQKAFHFVDSTLNAKVLALLYYKTLLTVRIHSLERNYDILLKDNLAGIRNSS